MKRVHLLISGLVQGVFFRQTTREKAIGLGLHGWVRNLEDGRVEAIIEGEEISVNELIKWCYDGPTSARVDNVKINWEDYNNEFSNFSSNYLGIG